MALDKVVDSSVLDADLTSVADSIRAKAKINDALTFPSGFKNAIDNIQVGVDTSDATARADDIMYGKSAYVNGGKVDGTHRYRKYTGEIVSTIVGQTAYAELAEDEILATLRNNEDLSVVVIFDVAPTAYTLARTIAFNRGGVLNGWGGLDSCQYISRYVADATTIGSQQTATPIYSSESDLSGTGALLITEDGKLRLYSRSTSNYAIRPCNYVVEVRW